jgi:hypothetical protein
MENNLTPQQERFITLLISGKSLSSIADELEVSRPTLYEWQRLETFQARYNQLLTDLKADMDSGVLGLYSKAVQALSECLESENDHIKFKVALYLIERAEKLEPGTTDPAAIVRKKFITITSPLDDYDFGESTELDQAGYSKRMKELGLAS